LLRGVEDVKTASGRKAIRGKSKKSCRGVYSSCCESKSIHIGGMGAGLKHVKAGGVWKISNLEREQRENLLRESYQGKGRNWGRGLEKTFKKGGQKQISKISTVTLW